MFLYWSKVVVLVVLAVFLGFGSYLVWTATQATKRLSQQTSTDLYNIGAASYNLNTNLQTAFGNLNRLCGTDKPCGLFEDAARTLNTVRKTFGQIEIAANHEDKQLFKLDEEENQLFSDAHNSLTNLVSLEVTLNSTINGIGPLEDKVGLELDSLHKVTGDVDALVTDQELIDLIRHADSTAAHIDGLSGDIQQKTHELIYPAACQGKLCWAKRTYSIVRGVVQLGEPAYYWGSLSTQILK
jgi:phosphoglycerate-specific signal transduction histidine kinase